MSQAATGFDPLQWVSSRLFPAGADAKSQAAQKQFNETLRTSPFLKAATDSLLKQMAMSPEESTQQLLKAGIGADQLKRITQATELEGLRGQLGIVQELNKGNTGLRIQAANAATDNTIRTGNATTDNLLRVQGSQQGQEQWMANLDQQEAAAYRDHDLKKYQMAIDAQKGNRWLSGLGLLASAVSAFV